MWLVLLVHVLGDLFRDHEQSGWAKAAWIVFLVVLPYIGVLAYIVAHGTAWGSASSSAAQARGRSRRYALRPPPLAGSGTADELAKLADLRDRGVLTEDEFNQQKAKILG